MSYAERAYVGEPCAHVKDFDEFHRLRHIQRKHEYITRRERRSFGR